jgi:hypothetical protein
MAFVIVEKGNSQDIGKKFPLGMVPALIGRPTPDNKPDIVLHDECVSRRHAEICYQQNNYRLRDLNSTNGTTIDNQRLTQGEYYNLKHGSAIGIGIVPDGERVILRFQDVTASSTVPVGELSLNDDNPVTWLKINENAGEIWIDGKRFNLPRKEFDLLLCLYNRAGIVCSREELISRVWPEVIDPGGVSDAAIDQLIRRLRSKIEPDPLQPRRLITRKGFGYMLV